MMQQDREELLRQLFKDMNAPKRLMHPYFSSVLADLGISPAQAHILSTINEEQPLSLKTLAAKMLMTPGAITQLVDPLERQSLITRTQDSKDRRVSYITIAPGGLKIIAAIHKLGDELMTSAVKTLTDAELQNLAAMQRKMTTQLEAKLKELIAKRSKL